MTEGRTIEVERRIRCSPETAFAFFTDPAKHVLWQGVRAELDPRPGGRYLVHYSEQTRLRGEYLEIDPPRRIVLSWGVEMSGADLPVGAAELPPGSTRVEIEFAPDGDATTIRIRHSGLPTEAASTFTTTGWTLYVDRIAAVAENRDPGPDPLAAAVRAAMRGDNG